MKNWHFYKIRIVKNGLFRVILQLLSFSGFLSHVRHNIHDLLKVRVDVGSRKRDVPYRTSYHQYNTIHYNLLPSKQYNYYEAMNLSLLEYLIGLLTVLLILSFFLIRHYASIQTSCTIKLLAIISFALGFSGTILLPIDLSLTEQQHQNDNNDDGDNNGNNGNNGNDEDNFTMMPWHILFWSTFMLAWIILPLVREMLLSGEFTIYTRFKDAIRKIIVGHLILLAFVIVFIIWLAFHLRELNVIPVLIALGNTYGLLLVALLLGYGLVAFPRNMWRQARPEYELRKVQLMAVKADDTLFEAVWQLQDLEFQIDCALCRIRDLDENNASDFFYKYCVAELLQKKNETGDLSPELHARRTTTTNRRRDAGGANGGGTGGGRVGSGGDGEEGILEVNNDGSQKPALEELVELNRCLKRAQEHLFNAEQRWNAILDKSRFFSSFDPNYNYSGNYKHSDSNSDSNDAYIHSNGYSHSNGYTYTADDKSCNNSQNDATSAIPLSPTGPGAARIRAAPLLNMADGQIKTCNARLMYIWVRYLRATVYRITAIFFAMLSIAILWSEATLGSKYNLSPLGLVQEYLSNSNSNSSSNSDDEDQDSGILFQIAALVPLLYMAICTANGLFQVGRFGPYCLRGNRQSHGVALVFNAQYLVRLQFPLAYNYLMMLKYDTSQTAFSIFLGQMDVVPLFGKAFPVYAPLLILFLCAFTLCNIYAKVMNLLGFEHQDALLVGDRETLDEKVNEGKTLLNQHLHGGIGNGHGPSSSEILEVEIAEKKSLNAVIV